MGKFIIIVMICAVGIFGGIGLYNYFNKSVVTDNYGSALNQAHTPVPTNSTITQAIIPPAQLGTDWVATLSAHLVSSTAATIRTAKGDISVVLYPQDAPKTVENFATLARYGYYNNLTFHRVEPGFVIQGGDPNGNGTGGVSVFGPTFEDELKASTSSYQAGYQTGVLAMANRGPNTNGSQFFIMLADNQSLPKNYTIFGKVTTGMDTVQKIAVGDKIYGINVQ